MVNRLSPWTVLVLTTARGHWWTLGAKYSAPVAAKIGTSKILAQGLESRIQAALLEVFRSPSADEARDLALLERGFSSDLTAPFVSWDANVIRWEIQAMPIEIPVPGASTWSSVEPTLARLDWLEREVDRYPWPGPFFAAMWTRAVGPEFFVRATRLGAISSEDLRTAITMTLIARFGEVEAAVEKRVAKKLKSAKRSALVKKIAVTALGVVLGAALSGVAVAIAQTALNQISDFHGAEAAKGLARLAKQFQTDAAPFAGELQATAERIDRDAARAQAAATEPREDLEAKNESKGDGSPGEVSREDGLPRTSPSSLSPALPLLERIVLFLRRFFYGG